MAQLVLTVDSDLLALQTIESMLRAGGYAVESSVSACDAARLVLNGLKPDLLLTGFIFPDTNGVALAQQIRCCLPSLPVLMMTAGAEDLPLGLQLQGVHVLRKPFLTSKLREAVSSALADRRAA